MRLQGFINESRDQAFSRSRQMNATTYLIAGRVVEDARFAYALHCVLIGIRMEFLDFQPVMNLRKHARTMEDPANARAGM